MSKHDDSKIFDVSKPSKVGASATSRPIIVGHHPVMNDPMIQEGHKPGDHGPVKHEGTPIHIAMDGDEPAEDTSHLNLEEPDIPSSHEDGELSASSENEDSEKASEESLPEAENSAGHHPFTNYPEAEEVLASMDEQKPRKTKEKSNPSDDSGDGLASISSFMRHNSQENSEGEKKHEPVGGGWQEVPPLSMPPGAGPRRRWPRVLAKIIGILLLIVIVLYLAIDAGLIKSDIKLPFHIFNKQKTSTTSTSPPPITTQTTPPPTVDTSIPAGFTEYKLAETRASFAYPTSWGAPAVTADPGYTKRGGTNKSDGTHAYLVNFANNKDVQLAFTSSKYLPVARDALYYDTLQWCVGTNDTSAYFAESVHFTATDRVDSPRTIACDQGPLKDVTKLDDTTIVQLKTKDSKNAVLGDVYTTNLASKDLRVLHVKDSTSKNSEQIKKLLATVKITPVD